MATPLYLRGEGCGLNPGTHPGPASSYRPILLSPTPNRVLFRDKSRVCLALRLLMQKSRSQIPRPHFSSTSRSLWLHQVQ